jgi:hypothetical protein
MSDDNIKALRYDLSQLRLMIRHDRTVLTSLRKEIQAFSLKVAAESSEEEGMKNNDKATNDRRIKEQEKFGCLLWDLETFVNTRIGLNQIFPSREAAAVSLLSDAQEELAMGMKDRARKTINRAKWLIIQGIK